MPKIVIVSGIQIIDNPRAVKAANCLCEAGYEVELIGAIYKKESVYRINRMLKHVKWKHIPLIDVTNTKLTSRLEFFLDRAAIKVFQNVKKYFNYESPMLLGYLTNRLLRIALNCKADLYIVHVEPGLWVAYELIKHGKKVAVDIEDWYSEDALPEDRKTRPIKLMKKYESFLLNNSVFSSTTSNTLAEALYLKYGGKKSLVVYNSFPLEERGHIDNLKLHRKNMQIPSIIWFSQTIGPGRGLEVLIDALNGIDLAFELHVLGEDRREFSKIIMERSNAALRNKIYFHPQVPQEELLSRLAEHDIGYCGEIGDCENKDKTVANKIMEYLRAGLAIVASDTSGHKEVHELTGDNIILFRQNDEHSLRQQLFMLLSNKAKIEDLKSQAQNIGDKAYSWHHSCITIKDAVASVI